MKLLKFLPIAAIALATVSCQNGGGTLSENATPTDSLMYYLGQMHASDYIRESERDTILKENSEKQAYLSGVKAGLAAMREGENSYNKGVMMGMQMASQILSFSEQMGVKVNTTAYVSSLTAAINADTIPNSSKVQSEFRKVMTNIENEKAEKDRVSSQESLQKVAQAAGEPKITDDLYGKVTVPNDSVALAEGDEVTLQLALAKENGDPLNLPLSPKGKIGNKRSFPEIISTAMLQLKSGETGEFLTTAHALLGNRAKQMNLEPNDVLKMTITATALPKEEPKE